MKKIISIILLLLLLFVSIACTTSKQIIRPKVKLEFLDAVTKEKLKDITVFITTQNDSLNAHLKKIGTSNKNGIIVIPKLKVDLENRPPTMPVNRIKCVFKNDSYTHSELVIFDYFKIDTPKELKKRYKATIYLSEK